MRLLLSVLILALSFQDIVCPPVNPQPVEEGSDQDDQDTGLHYDHYLREVVMTLEEDPDFRKKLEEANITEIKSGKIAMHLDKVAHHVREKLDEIKRKEVNRLRVLAKERMKAMQGIQRIDENILHHVDVGNPHSFEMKDLEKLIKKATKDLDELDKQRRQEFKTYEMEKEHERREHLKELPEEERKKEELKYEEQKKKHADHPKLHHPGSKDQLEEVWEKQDHLDKDAFDPKSFFRMHDIDGNGFLDEEEVEALFQKELDQVYDPNAPEDDMEERYEEMARMREHVLTEMDKDKDKLISIEEFMKYTKSDEFEKDEGWDTLENQEIYSEKELEEYEKAMMEEEARRRQQGAFDSHAQPGVVIPPHHQGGVQNMQMPQGVHPNQFAQPHPAQFGQHPGQFAQPMHPEQAAALQHQQMQIHHQQQQMMAQQQAHAQQQAQFHAQQQAQIHAQQQAQLHAQQRAQGMNIPAQPSQPGHGGQGHEQPAPPGHAQAHPVHAQAGGAPVQQQQQQVNQQAQIPQGQGHQAQQPGPPGGQQGQGHPPGAQPPAGQPVQAQPQQGQPHQQQGQPHQQQGQPQHQGQPQQAQPQQGHPQQVQQGQAAHQQVKPAV